LSFGRATARGVFFGAALLACALACAAQVCAQQLPEASAQLDADGRWVNGVTESWWQDDGITSADASGAAARWKEIGDELARAGGEAWAGDYFRGGDTHGTYMRWSPRAGFVIAGVDKCRAAVMRIVYGRVEATPTLVRFFPELEKTSAHAHGGGHAPSAVTRPVLRFVPVEWRGERMLVGEDEMGDFGDYVAGLGRYNQWANFILVEHTDFFSRRGGRGDDADSGALPSVPQGYERFLKRPVEASVVSVGRRVLRRDYHVESENTPASFERASLTYVTIDAGTERGVKRGMIFRVVSPAEGDSLVVVRAGRRASTAALVRDVDERGAETFYDHAEGRERNHSKVAAGWKLTTDPFSRPRP